MTFSRRPISRRQFLRGTGGALVALPLLQSLPARAQGADFPKRLIIWTTPNGVNPESWFPSADSTEFDFNLGPILQPLLPHKDKLIITSGIDVRSAQNGPGAPHQKGMGTLLSGVELQEGDFVGGDGRRAGWANGQTVDQYLADRIGRDTRLPSLELGVQVRGSQVRHRISYRGPADPLPPIETPSLVWSRLFADQQIGGNELARLTAQRRSVLDTVRQQFLQVRNRITPEDRAKLDAHAILIRDIERRLDIPMGGPVCPAPPEPELLDPRNQANMAHILELQVDLTIAALACDQTRVVTIQNSSGANNIRFDHLNSNRDDHQLSHAGAASVGAREEWDRRKLWYAEQFRRLLDGLAAVPEGDGTLLDNCLILWGSELGQGSTHSTDNVPFLLAGGCGGALRTGRWVPFGHTNHNNLLITLTHALGHPVETFGNPEYCDGPLAALLA